MRALHEKIWRYSRRTDLFCFVGLLLAVEAELNRWFASSHFHFVKFENCKLLPKMSEGDWLASLEETMSVLQILGIIYAWEFANMHKVTAGISVKFHHIFRMWHALHCLQRVFSLSSPRNRPCWAVGQRWWWGTGQRQNIINDPKPPQSSSPLQLTVWNKVKKGSYTRRMEVKDISWSGQQRNELARKAVVLRCGLAETMKTHVMPQTTSDS